MAHLHDLHPEQLARIGIFYLGEAMLDVLCEAYNQEPLTAKEVGRRVGISRRQSENWVDDTIAYGVLDILQNEKRVKNNQPGRGAGRWQLTEKEFEKRRDDL